MQTILKTNPHVIFPYKGLINNYFLEKIEKNLSLQSYNFERKVFLSYLFVFYVRYMYPHHFQ